MSCCHAMATQKQPVSDLEEERLRAASRAPDNDTLETEFHVPGMHCIACVRRIERALSGLDYVSDARANLSNRKVRIRWRQRDGRATDLSRAIEREGFEHAVLQIGETGSDAGAEVQRQLILSLAVAGFAAANVMLLSISVWSGADESTRQLFHLISGLIAVPAAAYAGRPFFGSALAAVRQGRLNMDVPISLAVIAALAMSTYEALRNGEHAYFDAAVMLLFFLLIGRVLDHMMRERARDAVTLLSGLSAKGAVEILADGSQRYIPANQVKPGARLMVAAGERVPVDGVIRSGASEFDRSVVTGESVPACVGQGEEIEAGTVNLGQPVEIEATKEASKSFLGEVIQMMEAAENSKARFVRIADRAARIYAPAVHLLAFAAFVGWFWATNGDWQLAAYTAIAVLIITCPCALGLAVPIVHVVGAGRLFERGLFMKDGSALEKLRQIDTVVFDKTGTLTGGRPDVTDTNAPAKLRQMAGVIARHSHHPTAQAVLRATADDLTQADIQVSRVAEIAGLGVEGWVGGRRVRLGRRDWVAEIAAVDPAARLDETSSVVWFGEEGGGGVYFALRDVLRPKAASAVRALKAAGLHIEIVSGDTAGPVADVARELGIDTFLANQRPADKIAHLEKLRASGRHVLMVGDGLNDAPALAAAAVSMAPSSGSDVGRQAADFVFAGRSLDVIPFCHEISILADRLVRQNIGIAVVYNCIAVPLAVAGYVTPLVAAIAMSGSSVVVVANSMRLKLAGRGFEEVPAMGHDRASRRSDMIEQARSGEIVLDPIAARSEASAGSPGL